MSFTKYPKNYHSNGYGWHNAAAMGYAPPPQPATTPNTGGYPGMPQSPYPMASLSMPMPGMPTAGSSAPYGMPSLPGSAGAYPNSNITGYQMSYGFAPNVLPSQIPNVPRHGAAYPAPGGYPPPQPPAPSQPAGIGWAIGGGGFGDSTDGDVHDPHTSQEEAKYQSIFVPSEDRPIYSNLRFFDVS